MDGAPSSPRERWGLQTEVVTRVQGLLQGAEDRGPGGAPWRGVQKREPAGAKKSSVLLCHGRLGSFKVALSHCFLTVFKSNCIFIIHGLHDPGSEQLRLPLVFFNFEKCSCA